MGTLTGICGSRITIRAGKTKHQLEAPAAICKQIAIDGLIPSPVKVDIEGRKVLQLTPRKLNL